MINILAIHTHYKTDFDGFPSKMITASHTTLPDAAGSLLYSPTLSSTDITEQRLSPSDSDSLTRTLHSALCYCRLVAASILYWNRCILARLTLDL